MRVSSRVLIAALAASLAACGAAPTPDGGTTTGGGTATTGGGSATGGGAASTGGGDGSTGGGAASTGGGDGSTGGGTASTGGGSGTDGGTDTPPTLTFTTSPVANLPAGVRFAQNIHYGADAEQVMDAFLPTSTTPTPVVFFFHGGGFTGGSRTSAYTGNAISQFTTAGVAYISADYRLLENIGVETEGVRKCLGDAALALQFTRRWASVFNIDPTRVAVYGSSAGAGTSLWLAYHDDLAVSSGSEIERQSTRVVAAAALATQATYDVLRWAPDVYAPEYAYVTNNLLLSQPALRGVIVQFYGLPASHVPDAGAILSTLTSAPYLAYRADADMLALMTPDDPPVFVQNTGANSAPTAPNFDLLHHPRHALTVRNFAADAGVTVDADVDAYNVMSSTNAVTFLLSHLNP